MARFNIDEFFNESDKKWIERAQKKINQLPKTTDTRTPDEIARDKAFNKEAAGWKESREKHQAIAQQRLVDKLRENQKLHK